MGSLVTAPPLSIVESKIPQPFTFPYVTLSGTLRRIGLPEPLILLVIGLLWTLVVAFSDNVGLAWNW
jgi:hypothetical protein